jgi:hypothetical protein
MEVPTLIKGNWSDFAFLCMEALDSKRLWWIIGDSEATSVEKESLISNPKSDKLLISQSVVWAFLSPNVYATHREAVKDISCSSQHAKCFRRVDYYGTSHRYNVEKSHALEASCGKSDIPIQVLELLLCLTYFL